MTAKSSTVNDFVLLDYVILWLKPQQEIKTIMKFISYYRLNLIGTCKQTTNKFNN